MRASASQTLSASPPASGGTQTSAPEAPAAPAQQHQRTWRRKQKRSAAEPPTHGRHHHTPFHGSGSPLLTHLAAKGFPLGKRPSANDSFAQVLRQSLEQPHLSPTSPLPEDQPRQQLQQQEQEQEQQRQQQRLQSGSSKPPFPPAGLCASTHEAIPEDAEVLSRRSGEESDDEASSISSVDSFCSCSSSLDYEQELRGPALAPASPFQAPSAQGSQASHPVAPPLAPRDPTRSVKHHITEGRGSSLHAWTHQQQLHHHHHHHHNHHRPGPDELHPAVEAFLQGSLAFAFSGGGFFFP